MALEWRTPLSSSSDSQRSREPSWSSVFVTPKRALHGRGGESPDPMPPAPSSVHHARAYCRALALAGAAQGATVGLGSPALLALFGEASWTSLAVIRGAAAAGALLPPAAAAHSLQAYVARAMLARATAWGLIIPIARLFLGPEAAAHRWFAPALPAATRHALLSAVVLAAVALDSAGAAVAAGVGIDGARLERQLEAEFDVIVPPRLLLRLRRRLCAPPP